MRIKKISTFYLHKNNNYDDKNLGFYEILDSISIPIFIKDKKGIFTDCNKAYEVFMGLSRDEIIGKSVYDIVSKELANQYHAKDQELFDQGMVQVYESRITIKGMDRYVRFHKSVYRSLVGEIKGLIGEITDITEQKKAEESLRASENKNKAILQAIPDAMVIVTPDFKIVDFKKARDFEHIGDRLSFIEKTVADVLPENVATLFIENITLSFQFQRVTCFEYQIIHNQEIRYREARSIVISAEQALVMIRDITERKVAEEEIHKLSLVVEQSPGEILITDLDQKIVYFNSTFSKKFGYTLEELKGHDMRLIMAGLQSDEFYRDLNKTIVTDNQWRGELCGRGKNGEVFWTLVSVSQFRKLDGEATSYLSMGQDITEKKLMEETLEKQSAEIRDALANLKQTQVQLVQQEKLAGIGQLAAGVAHEINNPLGFILSNFDSLKKYLIKITDVFDKYSELKKRVLESDTQILKELAQKLVLFEKQKKIAYIFEDLEPIIQESDDGLRRLGDIVKALKLFSRVDKSSELECYDLNAGIKNTLIIAKNEIKYVAEIEVDLGEVPEIQASAGQINQVLLNIIINAAHAIKEKQMDKLGMVKITSYHKEQFVYCCIQDNGLGMTAETIKNIFTAFFTTKPSGQGTGLGLSISYDIIVNKHCGDISVSSEKGIGTTFTIKLPLNAPNLQ